MRKDTRSLSEDMSDTRSPENAPRDDEEIAGRAGEEMDEDAAATGSDAQQPSGREQVLRALMAATDGDPSMDEIQKLRQERRAMNAQKRALTKQLRNESRKRARMLNRSAQLTNEDLVEVLQIRQARAAAAGKKETKTTGTEAVHTTP